MPGAHFADREAAVAKQLRTALHAIDESGNHEEGRERASTEAHPVCSEDFEASIASLAEEWNRPTIEIHTLGRKRLGPPGVVALNPAFDITPAKYVSAIITEKGVVRAPYRGAIRALF